MSKFFSTKEFLLFKKLKDRIKILNTKKNYSAYNKYRDLCLKMAKSEYKNIGWRENNNSYVWDNLCENELGPNMVCLGDNNEMSFYENSKLFMDEDFKTMVVKEDSGVIHHYGEEETKEIKDLSISDLKKIHEIKSKFEGRILSGTEKRELTSEQNKENTKRSR